MVMDGVVVGGKVWIARDGGVVAGRDVDGRDGLEEGGTVW